MSGPFDYQPNSAFGGGSRAGCRSWDCPFLVRRVSDAAQPELLVDLRRASSRSCWRCRSSPASCWRCTTRRMSTMAFNSVEHIMRDVNYGWLLRYLHANGASMFFIAVYIHMFRGLYYGSYKAPREVLWILGVHHLPADDGDRLHGLRAALGPDELLGRHRHHQPVPRHSRWSANAS